jgi:hypothetical protein
MFPLNPWIIVDHEVKDLFLTDCNDLFESDDMLTGNAEVL